MKRNCALISVAALALSVGAEVIGPVDSYDALEAAVAVARPGDTVRIAGGRYVFTHAIAIDKDITLEGAPDGSTVFWGDPKNDDYWYVEGVDPGSKSPAKTMVWNAAAQDFNDPESFTNVWCCTGANDFFVNNTTNGLNFVDGATHVVLKNLSFGAFRLYGVSLPAGSSGIVENCRFYANGCRHWQHSIDGNSNYSRASLFSAGSLRVSNSKFVGNNHALFANGNAAGITNVICGCRFVSNVGNFGGSAFRSAAPATVVSNCVFKFGNANPNSGYNTLASSAVTISTEGAYADFVDCTFETNTVSGYAIGCVVLQKSGTYAFDRCVFSGNRMAVEELAQSHYTAPHAACVAMQEATVTFRDSLFKGNSVLLSGTKSGAGSYPGASVLGVCKGTSLFVNCTLDGNVAENHYDDEANGKCNLVGTFAHSGTYYGSGTISFLHSVVENSSFLGYHTAEFVLSVMNKNQAGELSCPTFVNSLVLNDDVNYKPFLDTWTNGYVCVANSYFSRFNAEATLTDANTYCKNLYTGEGVSFTDKDIDNPGRPRQERLARDSFGVREGRNAWLVDGRKAYWFDEGIQKYRILSGRTGKYASVADLDEGTPLVPDAYGAPRRANHVALGPLNAPSGGIMVIFR